MELYHLSIIYVDEREKVRFQIRHLEKGKADQKKLVCFPLLFVSSLHIFSLLFFISRADFRASAVRTAFHLSHPFKEKAAVFLLAFVDHVFISRFSVCYQYSKPGEKLLWANLTILPFRNDFPVYLLFLIVISGDRHNHMISNTEIHIALTGTVCA